MKKKTAAIIGLVLFLLGLMGFLPNPFVGPDKFFHANSTHGFVHMLFGVFFLFFGSRSQNGQDLLFKFAFYFYLAVSLFGFVVGPGELFNLLDINSADNWLHLLIAFFIGWTLWAKKEEK